MRRLNRDRSLLSRLVAGALNNRQATAVAFMVAAGLGTLALVRLPVDAFPDTTPVQVQVNTVAPSLAPEEIERQISYPVETAIAGLPGLDNVRSISKFGFSQVVATFTDDTPILDARQLIMERLGTVQLPEDVEPPSLGPIATGLGEVFHYLVWSPDGSRTLADLRTFHDWIIKPELRKVSGVAEVNSWGGEVMQYQVEVRTDALGSYGLTLDDVVKALEANNRNVGGGVITASGEDLLVQGTGRLTNIEDIEGVVIRSRGGVPLHIADVAEVRRGSEIRRGAVTANGRGEAVLGLGFMLMGENSREVTRNLADRLEDIRPSLPEGIEVEVLYDRTELVGHVIETVIHNLVLGAALVIAVLLLLFGSIRAGLIIALTIPLSLVLAALGMRELGIAASLLSLGAMDFGVIVDGSVVMAENNLRRLALVRRRLGRPLTFRERLAAVTRSSREVVRPVFFGVTIITLVLVPVLALSGVEGKLFRPMALTMLLALAGALLVALFLTPALSLWFLPKSPSAGENRIVRYLQRLYAPALRWAVRFRRATVLAALAVVVVSGLLALSLGSEFVPRLNEGAITINVVRLAGISIEESVAYNTRMERLLLENFSDEIAEVWSRIGTAEVATDPMGTELTDIFIALEPRGEWTRVDTYEELVTAINEVIGDLPGQTLAFTQPIEMRLNEMLAGIRTDLGVKIFGDDLDELVRLADQVHGVLQSIPGAEDVSVEQVTGQPVLRVEADREALSRYGVPSDHLLEMVAAVGGIPTGAIQEGQLRFPLVVRLPEEIRRDPDALGKLLVGTSEGVLLPVESVARIVFTQGPATITREWGRRRMLVQTNIRGRDMGSFVAEARSRIAEHVPMPPGYVVEFGGQFERLESSSRRFAILVPSTLALVFFLLYMSLRRIGDTLIVFTGIPFAAVGGILALWLRGLPFSVSAAVGFIALSGIAVLNGQVLVSTIRSHVEKGTPMMRAVTRSARRRLRPVLATAVTDATGFLPMALSTGVGAEVQRPLATVVVGGVITSTVLTLIVLPSLYMVFESRLGRSEHTAQDSEAGEPARRRSSPGEP